MRGLIPALLLVAVPVLAAERPSDKDIKQLLERVHHDRDRFEDQLDGKLKREVLRGPQAEVNVGRFLDDLQENVGQLKDRFSADYAASAECTTLLQQASHIHRFMAAQPSDFKGASEWNRFAGSLNDLAVAYGTVFPLPEGATARRMNDREVQRAADELADAVEVFKKELDSSLKAGKVDDRTRRAALDEVDALKNAAGRLASRVGDGQPTSAEVKALVELAGAVERASANRPLSPAAQSVLASVRGALEKVTRGYGLTARSGC